MWVRRWAGSRSLSSTAACWRGGVDVDGGLKIGKVRPGGVEHWHPGLKAGSESVAPPPAFRFATVGGRAAPVFSR